MTNNTSNAYLVKALANLCSECPQWTLRNLEVPPKELTRCLWRSQTHTFLPTNCHPFNANIAILFAMPKSWARIQSY